MGFAGAEPRRRVRNIRVFGNEPLEIAILGNISGRSINESIIVSPVNAVFLSEFLDHFRLKPAIAFRSNGGIVLLFASLFVNGLATQKTAATAGFDGAELSDSSNKDIVMTFLDFSCKFLDTSTFCLHWLIQLRCIGNFFPQLSILILQSTHIRQALIHIQIERPCNRLRLTHILEGDLLMREELLEDIRDLELSARGCPLTGVLTIFVLGNINGVVDEAHAIISRFVLENITVHLAVVHDELNDLRRSVRNLDRVRLYVSNNKAPFLNLVLEVDHKQGSALGDDIIFVTVVMERILEAGRSQTVNGVDGNF